MTPDLSTVLETIAEQPFLFEEIVAHAKQNASRDPILKENWKNRTDNVAESEHYDTFLQISNSADNSLAHTKYEILGLYFSNNHYQQQIHQAIEDPTRYSPNPILNPQPA